LGRNATAKKKVQRHNININLRNGKILTQTNLESLSECYVFHTV